MNAVTATPLRESWMPACAGASLPGFAVLRLASSGMRVSIAGV